jgi:hypothetical protein
MKRLGSADTGVSIMFPLLEFFGVVGERGGGGARGLGGPEAPAERRAEADGEGGGRTTPEEWESELFPPLGRRFALVVLVLERGLEFESAVALPPSGDGSSGIWTFRTGRLPPPSWAEFVREGGVKPSGTEDIETLRFLLWVLERTGGGGDVLPALFRVTVARSTDCDRLFEAGAGSLRVGSAFDVDEAQCCERIDRDSSIGVKMLRDFTDIRFTGSSICWEGCGSSCS